MRKSRYYYIIWQEILGSRDNLSFMDARYLRRHINPAERIIDPKDDEDAWLVLVNLDGTGSNFGSEFHLERMEV